MEGDITKKRANWITNIVEYDVDVRPTKIVRGKGLCKYIVHECEPREDEMATKEVVIISPESPNTCWMEARKHFMKIKIFLEGLPPKKKRFYRLQNNSFRLVDGVLFKRNFHGVLLRCVDQCQADKILHEFYYGSSRGHFSAQTTIIKITCAGYFWPSMFKYVHTLVRECKECQYYAGRCKKAAMPLRLVMVEEPFSQWGLNFIGMINPPSSTEHKWILTTMDYFTRWSEVIPLKNSSESEVLTFLEDPVCRYGPSKTIISNNTCAFTGS